MKTRYLAREIDRLHLPRPIIVLRDQARNLLERLRHDVDVDVARKRLEPACPPECVIVEAIVECDEELIGLYDMDTLVRQRAHEKILAPARHVAAEDDARISNTTRMLMIGAVRDHLVVGAKDRTSRRQRLVPIEIECA